MNFFRKKPSLEERQKLRSQIKVYDIFTLFNELDLLEIRLNILEPYVDYFVIVEATETFSGQPKKLTYLENKERFKKFEHKIKHFVIDDTPTDPDELRLRLQIPNLSPLDREIINNALSSDNIPPGVIHWFKEFYQKEAIKRALVGLADDDVCFISDVDEIWNPDLPIDFSRNDVFKLRQYMYAYYLNNRSNEEWAGTMVTKYKNIKNNCLNHLRTASKTKYTYLKNGGWHFTNQGGATSIEQKVEASYGPQDYNNPEIKSKIKERMDANVDYIGRHFTFWIDESDLPKFLVEHKTQYSSLFK